MKEIQPIYRGNKFRNLLCARWAVFFDSLGIDWQYESAIFDHPLGLFSPDFMLPCRPNKAGFGCHWVNIIDPPWAARSKDEAERERVMARDFEVWRREPVWGFHHGPWHGAHAEFFQDFGEYFDPFFERRPDWFADRVLIAAEVARDTKFWEHGA